MIHNGIFRIVMVMGLALSAGSALAQEAAPVLPKVKVYLPRQVKSDAAALKLGQICVVRCDDAELSAKAEAVAMGRAALSKEALVLDRQTILSRLAAEGVPAGRVEFSGADKVTITRDEAIVLADALLSAADAFLKANAPQGAVKWVAVKAPQPLTGKLQGEPTLKARLLTAAPVGHVRVEIVVLDGAKPVDKAEILFRLQYSVRQVVAVQEIAAGDTITPQNVEVRTTLADRPNEVDLPYGRVAASKIQSGATITPTMLKPAKPVTAIKKDQTIVMKIAGPTFTVSAMGQALEDGQVGQFIKVRNVDSKRVLMAKVRADGTVEPVMQEAAAKASKADEAETAPIAIPDRPQASNEVSKK